MQTYPLESLTLDEAKELQFRLVDLVTEHFSGAEVLSLGDLGVVPGLNRPHITAKAEAVLARFFDAEAAALVRGAGSGAIRCGLGEIIRPGGRLLVHDAPVYPTTATTIEQMGLRLVVADFNDFGELATVLSNQAVDAALVQYTRQKPGDRYGMEELISYIKQHRPELPMLTDDNYAVLKVRKIGVQCGAELSAFSLFKLLGPEGIGCVVGRKVYVENMIRKNYSGGGQVQGHEALAALRGLVYAPVALAIQGEVVEQLCRRLNAGEVAGVKTACIANAQSKVLLVEFEHPVADRVLAAAEKLGAAPYPVGAESKYEFVPMFYRLSGTFRAGDPLLAGRMIRVNPMRCGADTVVRILKQALAGL